MIDAGSIRRGTQASKRALTKRSRSSATDAGIPLIVVEGAKRSFFGPVLSPAPTGRGVRAVGRVHLTRKFEVSYEIKRTRDVRPILGRARFL